MKINKENSLFYGIAMKITMPILLIASGCAAWAYFHSTVPRIKRTPPALSATIVDILTVQAVDAQAVITAMGTVTPSREIILKARVSGEVQTLSPQFVPGGHIAKGSEILKLDPSDYQVELRKAESALEKAWADLAIEQGNQAIAREELRLFAEMSKDTLQATDLALRKPHLKQAQAMVSSVEADLRMARLNLNRTVIHVPFNALVTQRNVNIGSYVSTQDSLATLVGTDEYWIKALVPLDRLSVLDMDRKGGIPALIYSSAGPNEWHGRVLHVTGKVSETSRMATVIIAVPDPLGLHSDGNSPKLMLDDYVSVKIHGKTLVSVIELPRSALRDGNTVWVFNGKALEIRNVVLAWKQEDRVFVRSGLETGEKVIVSDLSTPVQGMRLMVSNPVNDVRQVARANVEEDLKQ